MKISILTAVALISLSLLPAVVHAGEHVYGVWSTDEDRAMKTAFSMAEAKVRSRGKGCVGRGKNDSTTEELIMREDGEKIRYGVFISHHNGSCRIKQNIIQDIARETGIDANRIISAWVSK